jgi:hypothetical protein
MEDPMIGKVFGRLTVVGREGNSARGERPYRVGCTCGEETVVQGRHLRDGRTKSCGCLQRERVTKHSGSESLEYESWRCMKQRCNNPNHPDYPNWGGRGIGYCERWESFTNFRDDMPLKPSPAHELDRIDPHKDYTPENCRWAVPILQAHNKRDMGRNSTGYAGVRKLKSGYRAQIMFDKVIYNLGIFPTAVEAGAKYLATKEIVVDRLARPAPTPAPVMLLPCGDAETFQWA